ncbi:hypothetical protein PHMEG_00032306 [Phytophthora megakarya]|uniref:PiggyBac transposable element-derived protein domain-containing protein n=1 Tax=Phytophthora megakarya TaxID=4795 RepID=A0A225UVT8_9STRA|nr:hypothetical protein PHMEG_00032306 [Phytophthora megakarya]
MSKTRFGRVMQNLHFTDNTDARAETDRAWKVRSVVDTLQESFRNGYKIPPVLTFDEAMILSKSHHNTQPTVYVVTDRFYTSVQLAIQIAVAECVHGRHNTDRQEGVSADLITQKTYERSSRVVVR